MSRMGRSFSSLVLFMRLALIRLTSRYPFSSRSVSAVLGWFTNRAIYERMRVRGIASVAGTLIATLSLMFILQNALLAIFSSDTKTFPALQGALHTIGPVNMTDHELRLVVISLALVGMTHLFLFHTRLGKALRAVADQATNAEVVGISAQKIPDLVFILGSSLAGVAGILFAIEYGLDPSMATMVAFDVSGRRQASGPSESH